MRVHALRTAKLAVALAAANLVAGALPAPAAARDSLGIWNDWGAFRDIGVPRCYAIAMAVPVAGRRNTYQPYLTVGIWPRRGARGELHVRLARAVAPGGLVRLSISGQTYDLVAGQSDAWTPDARTNAAVIAAMRSAGELAVTARTADGRLVRDVYRLAGAASAMDAAALGCAHG